MYMQIHVWGTYQSSVVIVCVHEHYMYMLYRVTLTVLQSIYCIAPNDRMKEVLRKTISEAKAAVSKVHVHTPDHRTVDMWYLNVTINCEYLIQRF